MLYTEELVKRAKAQDDRMPNFEPIPFAEDVEACPSDEADDIRRATEALKSILQQSHSQSGHW